MPTTKVKVKKRRQKSAPPTAAKTSKLIDVHADRLRPVNEIAQERLGKRLSPATQWRWIQQGNAGGRLEAVYVGATWMTTPEAFGDFLQRMTAAKLRAPIADDNDPPAERPEATSRALQQRGLLPRTKKPISDGNDPPAERLAATAARRRRGPRHDAPDRIRPERPGPARRRVGRADDHRRGCKCWRADPRD